MKTKALTSKFGTERPGGFSPIETVGAISIIGMLAVSVLPRVFTLVTDTRLNGAARSYLFAKAATLRYLDQSGAETNLNSFLVDADKAAHWDVAVLRPAGLLDEPFATPVSQRARVAISACPPAYCLPTGDNNAYSFSGFTPTASSTTSEGKIVVEAILEGVALADARALNRRIDGEEPLVGETGTGVDLSGRVKYAFGSGKTGNVHLYLTHR